MKWFVTLILFLVIAHQCDEVHKWKNNYEKVHEELHQLEEQCKSKSK